jgi:carbon-monoxide dehydrogenase large subunit
MNLQNDPQSFALMKFGVGQPVRRTEDPMLVRGEGCYTDDIKLTGEAYAVMVRSRIAHGVIKGIDTTAARNMPGVLGVYTGADLAAYGTLKCIVPFNNRDGTPMKRPPRPALATDKVRFVGDPVAFVVADTALHAKDAAEAVEVDIDALPAVVRPEEAARPGAPLIHDEAPGNVALDYHFGDSEQVAVAFDKAAHITRLKLSNSRVVVNAMEPRAAIGIHDPASGRFTLHAPSQGAFGMRGNMAEILKVEPKQVRILTGHVGGSFGMKSAPFPEYVCVLHAARALGRPVKWTDERSGSFVSDSHVRDHDLTAELALDADGTFLALRITNFGNMGGFLAQVAPMPSTLNTVKNVQSVYRTPLIEVSTKCMFTNTSHVSAYRGAGRPEGNYYMERLIDACGRRDGDRPRRVAPAQPDPAARNSDQDRFR